MKRFSEARWEGQGGGGGRGEGEGVSKEAGIMLPRQLVWKMNLKIEGVTG